MKKAKKYVVLTVFNYTVKGERQISFQFAENDCGYARIFNYKKSAEKLIEGYKERDTEKNVKYLDYHIIAV